MSNKVEDLPLIFRMEAGRAKLIADLVERLGALSDNEDDKKIAQYFAEQMRRVIVEGIMSAQFNVPKESKDEDPGPQNDSADRSDTVQGEQQEANEPSKQ